MEYSRISGIEPSSMIHSHIKYCQKLKCKAKDTKKTHKKILKCLEAIETVGVKKVSNIQFHRF